MSKKKIKEKNESLWITLAIIGAGVIICIVNPILFILLILAYILTIILQQLNN